MKQLNNIHCKYRDNIGSINKYRHNIGSINKYRHNIGSIIIILFSIQSPFGKTKKQR